MSTDIQPWNEAEYHAAGQFHRSILWFHTRIKSFQLTQQRKDETPNWSSATATNLAIYLC